MHEKEAKILEITCVRWRALRMKPRELQWAWRVGGDIQEKFQMYLDRT